MIFSSMLEIPGLCQIRHSAGVIAVLRPVWLLAHLPLMCHRM
jgi:hypothetical protein